MQEMAMINDAIAAVMLFMAAGAGIIIMSQTAEAVARLNSNKS